MLFTKSIIGLSFSILCCFLILGCKPDPINNSLTELNKLKISEIFEISLSGGSKMANPYVEGLRDGQPAYVTAEFKGISGDAADKKYNIPAFWDGTNGWKIRFTPPFSGTWEYETSARDNIAQKRGKLEVTDWTDDEKKANPTRRGFIQINQKEPRSGRYFVYMDGTPFLWIADSWWNWTSKKILFESFKDLVDTRAEQGFTVGQLFFAGRGWNSGCSLLDSTFQHPDIDQIRKVEKMIAYANSKGITVWINFWWGKQDLKSNIGEENLQRWCRYVVHRLHVYNVTWVLAGEYNSYNYGGLTLDFWNKLGELIKAEDPCNRIVSVHTTPPLWTGGAAAPQWSSAEAIHDQPWLDYNQGACGHQQSRNILIPGIVNTAYLKQPAKPIVITEPWYEFIVDNAPAKDIRFGAWSAFFSGAAGHSYGGGHIWIAYLSENPYPDNNWPIDRSFAVNTCYYPGAVSIGFMSRYLQKIKWWEFSPHQEYLPENSTNFCVANPGKEYMAYLPNGGILNLNLSSASGSFSYEWLDLKNNKIDKSGSVLGGQKIELSSPDNQDWVIRFYK